MPRLHLNGFIFTPKLWSSALLLIFLAILLSLGCWQLRRATEKQQLTQAFAQRQAPLRQLQRVQRDPKAFAYRSVEVKGHFDNQHSFLIDNRIHQHRAGYFVITPLILANTQQQLLVNRGWLPRLRDRRQLPAIVPVRGEQVVRGLIKPPGKLMLLLAADTASTQWPRLLQNNNINTMAAQLRASVYDFTLLLSPRNAHGFVRQWRVVTMKASKHIGYAIQWFALGLTLVIIYLVVNTRRESYESSRKKDPT